MKKLIYIFLATLVCGSAAYAEDSQDVSKKDVDVSVDDRTWSDGRPMTDAEYEHMQDVLSGFDNN